MMFKVGLPNSEISSQAAGYFGVVVEALSAEKDFVHIVKYKQYPSRSPADRHAYNNRWERHGEPGVERVLPIVEEQKELAPVKTRRTFLSIEPVVLPMAFLHPLGRERLMDEPVHRIGGEGEGRKATE